MQKQSFLLSVLAGAASASMVLSDPSDTIDPADWATDNARIPDYNYSPDSVQPSDIEAAYTYTGSNSTTTLSHQTFSVDANDTSVILVTEGADLTVTYSTILKEGYYTDLYDSSFWGFNAAINVANTSTATFDHVNVTVHNGAANVYAYGSDTVVTIDNSWLYSSGAVSHGLYAAGNATIYGSHITHFSGGRRSSAYAGDSPAGYVYISESSAHTAGIGSACFYALGEIHADTVVCETEQAPTLFMDGNMIADFKAVSARAEFLASTVIFSSGDRLDGAILNLTNSHLESVGDDVYGLWFGNVIAYAYITSSEIVTESGVLILANTSQVTQDFDYFAGSEENSDILPAEVYAVVSESSLVGDLVAYNGSSISLELTDYSSWTGSAYSGYGNVTFNVTVDSTSSWTLTEDTTVTSLSASMSNIISNGYTLYYSAAESSGLSGTYNLTGGGAAIAV